MGLVYVAVAGLGPGGRAPVRVARRPVGEQARQRPGGDRAAPVASRGRGVRVTVRGAAAIGAGLAPARPARAIARGRADPRGRRRGRRRLGGRAARGLGRRRGRRLRPGRREPVHARRSTRPASRCCPATTPAHVEGDAPPARLAVTKALTAIDPDHPELAAARAAGIPLEPWQQVVADAAAGRRLVAVAGTHGKSTSAGWLVHVLAAGGLDPGAFVGALLPADLTGIGVAATARRGSGAPFVVEADEYAGNFDPYRPAVIVLTSAEWDHPDVFADRAARARGVRGVDPGCGGHDGGRRRGAGARGERRRPRRRRARRAAGRLAGPGGRHRAGHGARRVGPGARHRSAAGSWTRPPRARGLPSRGLDPADPAAAVEVSIRARRAGTTPPTRSGVAAAASVLGLAPAGDRGRARVVPRRRPPARAQGRGARRGRVRRLRPPPDGDPRDARGRPAARAGPPRLGRLRAADLPPHGGAARRVRRRAGGRRRRRDRRHLGRAATPTRPSPRPPGSPRPSRTRAPGIVAAAPGSVEATAAWLADHVRAGRRGAGDGRRPVVPDRGAAARAARRRDVTLDLRPGPRPARGAGPRADGLRRRRLGRALRRVGRGLARPVRAAARRSQRPAGILERRRPRPSAGSTSRSSGTGPPGTRRSPRGMPAGRAARTRPRSASRASSSRRRTRTAASCGCGNGR